jgi:hypothetical protein
MTNVHTTTTIDKWTRTLPALRIPYHFALFLQIYGFPLMQKTRHGPMFGFPSKEGKAQ